MQTFMQPTGYYKYADFCPHDINNEDDEPNDGIHVSEENEGYLICLDTPTQPIPVIVLNKGYFERPGILNAESVALQCETCTAVVDMLEGQERWMQKHVADHNIQNI